MLLSRTFTKNASYGRLCATLAFVLAGAVGARAAEPPAGQSWLARAQPIRIMALGDSITAGVGKNGVDLGTGGYRAELVRLLESQGFDFTMIGSRSDYSARLTERGHEGWPGYVIRSYPSAPAHQLSGALTREALEAYEPDVILLMAGTNDLLRATRHKRGYTVANTLDALDALLAEITEIEPNATVLVAGVVDSPKIARCDVAAFDGTAACGAPPARSVPTIVASYAARGFRVALASEMAGAVARDAAHFPDGIHPSGADGYLAVAKAWVAALDEITSVDHARAVAGP